MVVEVFRVEWYEAKRGSGVVADARPMVTVAAKQVRINAALRDKVKGGVLRIGVEGGKVGCMLLPALEGERRGVVGSKTTSVGGPGLAAFLVSKVGAGKFVAPLSSTFEQGEVVVFEPVAKEQTVPGAPAPAPRRRRSG